MSRSSHADSPELCELLPWYANGTLGESDVVAADAHLRVCSACRSELPVLRRVQEAIGRESVAVLVPPADAREFIAKVDRPARRARAFRLSWFNAAVAAGVALIVAGAYSWISSSGGPEQTVFETATESASGSTLDYVLQVSITHSLDIREHEAVLEALQPESVSGPDADGNYRVVVRLPVRSLGELEDYRLSVESLATIERARIVAVELPVEAQ